MDITEKLNNFINSSESKQNIDEKEYKITASDSLMSGKVVIDLSQLPRSIQKSAMNNLENGSYSVDDIAGWLIINT